MSEEAASSSRKRSSSSVENATTEAVEHFGGEPILDYDAALEAGYWGGPIDTTDHTVAGEIAAAKEGRAEG